MRREICGQTCGHFEVADYQRVIKTPENCPFCKDFSTNFASVTHEKKRAKRPPRQFTYFKKWEGWLFLSFEHGEDVVADAGVVGVFSLVLFHPFHHADGDRQDDDFIDGFQDQLREHHQRQLLVGQHAVEGQREKDDGVGAFAPHGAHDGPQGEALAVVGNFHAAHDIGVDETACYERHEGGQGDARRQSEDGVEAGLVVPIGCAGDGIGQRRNGHEEEVGEEACPNQYAGAPVSPHLAYHVVDDVGDGEDEQAAREMERPEHHLLGFQDVGGYQAHGENDAELHEQHRHHGLGFLFVGHIFRGVWEFRR